MGELRRMAMVWAGVFFGAIALFSNLDGIVSLSRWSKFIVDHWKYWTHSFWSYLLWWVKIDIQPASSTFLTAITALLMLSVGSRWRSAIVPPRDAHMAQMRASDLIAIALVICLMLAPLASMHEQIDLSPAVLFLMGVLAGFMIYIATVAFAKIEWRGGDNGSGFIAIWAVFMVIGPVIILLASGHEARLSIPSFKLADYVVIGVVAIATVPIIWICQFREFILRIKHLLMFVAVLIASSQLTRIDFLRLLQPPNQ
jgi:hypothetical protein